MRKSCNALQKCAHMDLQRKKRRVQEGGGDPESHGRWSTACCSGSQGLEQLLLTQISPLQLSQFWLQFALAWQLGRGLLGVDPREDIRNLCKQMLVAPSAETFSAGATALYAIQQEQPEHARLVVEHHAVSERLNRLESSCREHGYQGAFSAADATERGSAAGVMAVA